MPKAPRVTKTQRVTKTYAPPKTYAPLKQNTTVKTQNAKTKRAYKEIQAIQKFEGLFIKRAPFIRLVKEITQDSDAGTDMRWKNSAIEALRWATEDLATAYFELLENFATHAKRVTVMQKDAKLLQETARMSIGSKPILEAAYKWGIKKTKPQGNRKTKTRQV